MEEVSASSATEKSAGPDLELNNGRFGAKAAPDQAERIRTTTNCLMLLLGDFRLCIASTEYSRKLTLGGETKGQVHCRSISEQAAPV